MHIQKEKDVIKDVVTTVVTLRSCFDKVRMRFSPLKTEKESYKEVTVEIQFGGAYTLPSPTATGADLANSGTKMTFL